MIGVLEHKGQTLDGRDQDDAVLIPITTAQTKLFGTAFPGTVRFIITQARSDELMDDAQADLTQLLRARHRLADGAENDFTIRNLTAIAETAALSARAMGVMLGAIASVSLLVGGIGIMNIMLVSVTERTREIGIRLAIGAHEKHILIQFLVEATVLSLFGGLLGIALGLALAGTASWTLSIPFAPSLAVVILAVAFSAAIGMVFGFFPALRGARLDPIDALRHE